MERSLSSALIAEGYGTFLLVLVGPTTITIVNNPQIFPIGPSLGLGFIGLAHGLALLVGIATVAHISGAHFNPAITISLAYSNRFPRRRVVPYVLAQLAGASLAGFVQLGIVGVAAGRVTDLGNTVPNPALPLPVFSALLAEIVGTLILAMTVLGTTNSQNTLPWAASSVGLSLAAVIWALGAVSGASLNPARTFGPSLASLTFDLGAFSNFWIYVVGPILGGLLAAELYRRMSGR